MRNAHSTSSSQLSLTTLLTHKLYQSLIISCRRTYRGTLARISEVGFPLVFDIMRASHILVKHQGSRRTASWKDTEGVEIKSRTKMDAINLLLDLKSKIYTEEDFAETATEYSDCGSARCGGDLGNFESGQMMKPFEDATRSLRVGEISGIVDTDSGVHIILRTG